MTDLENLLNKTGNQRKRREYANDFGDWCYRKMNGLQKFWICYVEGTDGGRRYRHSSLESAEKEAERLATLPDNQGKTVYLFECIGRCRIQPFEVKWEIPR